VTKRKIITVFGTRPEAIKLAPVIEKLRQEGQFEVVVVVTAQHREMLDGVLQLFDITPHYDLNIMVERQNLFDVTVKSLSGLRDVLGKEKPSLLIVQGDTTTTLSAALSAFYLKIPIAHVEAGLRTFDKYHPFPEEMNRQLTSLLADFCFAPTEIARGNLQAEGVRDENIFVTGNTVIDALLSVAKKARPFTNPVLKTIDFDSNRIILVTAHRRENWGEPLRCICTAISRIVDQERNTEVIFSVHRNPLVRQTVSDALNAKERVHLVDPLSYEEFVRVMEKSYLILTDSGGIQEEAPALRKPVLVMREITERPEAIEAGTARLVGTDTDKIVAETCRLLDDSSAYASMANAVNPYGDGKASDRIVAALEKVLL
jgi:UDP-N-acetylglucosamine 2-epimerase (non-hydrolysing)